MRSALAPLGLVLALAGCGGFNYQPLGSAVVKGRVVGADPNKARVTLRLDHDSGGEGEEGSSGSDGEDSIRAGVDAEGRFELRAEEAAPGVLFIVASATHAARVAVNPMGGKVLDLGDITPDPGAFFSVTVMNASSQPVSHAELDLDGTDIEHVPVDGQGRARLGPLPAGCYRVRAKADGYDEVHEDRCPRAGEEILLTLVMGGEEP
jgi:hypothetical protein